MNLPFDVFAISMVVGNDKETHGGHRADAIAAVNQLLEQSQSAQVLRRIKGAHL